MKIEKITINNLGHLKGEFVFDLTSEPFASASTFVVTGEPEGKQSLLAMALSLSLYGKAPGFDKTASVKPNTTTAFKKDAVVPTSDPRSLLYNGEKEGGCSVTFSLPDGRRFEAGWMVKQSQVGVYGNSYQAFRQIYPRMQEYAASDVQEAVLTEVGLSYEQFISTVLLSQRKFEEFLLSTSEDRPVLLERLTGTAVYGEMSKTIHERCEKAEATVHDHTVRIETVKSDFMTDETHEKTLREQKELQTQIEEVTQRRDEARLSVMWINEFEEAQNDLFQKTRQKEDAEKLHNSRRADEHNLEMFDKVQPVQMLYNDIQNMRRTTANTREQIDQANRELVAASQRQQTARKDYERAVERREEAVRQLEAQKETIEQGYELMGEIKTSAQNIERQQNVVTDCERVLKGRGDSCAEKERQLRDLEDKHGNDKFHRQTLVAHHRMFENFSIVKDRLNDFSTETANKEELHKRLEQKMMQQSQLQQSVDNLEREMRDSQTKMTALRNVIDVHRQAVRGIDGPELQQRTLESKERLQLLLRAEKLWDRISEANEAISARQAKYNRDEVEIEQLRGLVQAKVLEINRLAEENERRQQALALSQSKDVEGLRKQLQEGTACPICGAAHHPYHTETESASGELMSSLSYEAKESTNRLTQQEEQLRQLEIKLSRMETQHKADMEYLDERRAHLRDDVEEWKNYTTLDNSFADSTAGVNGHARQITISMLIDKSRRESLEYGKQLREYNNHQNHINRLNEEISALDVNLNEGKERHSTFKSEYLIVQATVEDLRRAVELSDRKYHQLYHDLNELITLPNWLDEWKKNAEDFAQRLNGLEADWQRVNNVLANNDEQIMNMRVELNRLQLSESEARRQLQEADDLLKQEVSNMKQKERDFKKVFGEGGPQQMQNDLESNVAHSRSEEEKARRQLDDKTAEVQRIAGMKAQLETLLQKQDSTLQNLQSNLDTWIREYNMTNSPLQMSELASLFAAENDYIKLRISIDKVRHAHQEAVQDLDAARQRIDRLKQRKEMPRTGGDEGRDMLEQEIERLTVQLTQMNRQYQEVSSMLLRHEMCLKRVEQLTDELRQAEEDHKWWLQMDEILGSADGSKFRTCAQQYIFDSLVMYANQQLKMMAPRYQLKVVEGRLMAEVVDRDRLDQLRHVAALSSGEMFVVTLALALALSTLSAHHLAIGTLFVQSDFGNLDICSRNLILDALCNLQSVQGRKIGVITQSEAIASQITPQVRVLQD